MKKHLFAGIAAACFAAPAFAAPPATSMFNWTGFYVGVNGGGMSNRMEGDFSNTPTFLFNPRQSAQPLAGFYGGVQYQIGNVLIGGETGFDTILGDKFGSAPGTGIAGADCGFIPDASCEGRISHIFRIGGRLGWAFERWLVYGTGGYARAQLAIQSRGPVGVVEAIAGPSDGRFVGGGIEFALLNNLFFGVEYKHFKFDEIRLQSPTINPRDISAKADAVTARLTIKFGN